MSRDERLSPKRVVIGVDHRGDAAAVSKDDMRSRRVVELTLDGEPVVVLYDATLDDALAYRPEGRRFRRDGDAIIDERGARWTVWGTSDRGERLEHVPSFDVMWFAWAAFHPDTALVGEE